MKKLIFIIIVVLSNSAITAQDCNYISRIGSEKPVGFYINRPNPFSPSTLTEFGLPDSGRINIKIYDVLGKEVFSGSCYAPGGKYVFNWVSLSEIPSGFYTFKLISDINKSYFVEKMHFECEKIVPFVK